MNYKIIWSILGQLLFLEAVMLIATCGVAYIYHENALLSFGVPTLVSIIAGSLLKLAGRGFENRMGRREGFLIVSSTWIMYSIVGMLPFLISGTETRLSCAFFEAMSGFTTTGATVLNNIDSLPHCINFWRTLSHWVGGVGIVFFTIAILPNMGVGEQKLFSAEATGLNIGKLHPRIRTTARWIGSLYVFLTIACAVSLFFAGMSPFDAICHAFSTMGTGGFSTHQDSIAYFNSVQIEYILTIFMFFAGINFSVLYLAIFKRRWRDAWKDGELRCFLLILVSVIIIGTLVLHFVDHRPWETAFRLCTFHTISIQSTTGYTTEDFMLWHPSMWMFVAFITIVGACAGSTSGGIKCIRVLTIWKTIINEFKLILHPHAVFPIRINDTFISTSVVRNVYVFVVCYFGLTLVGSMTMMAMGLPMMDAVSCCITSLSNVGPGFGYVIGPLDSWNPLPDAALWINSFLMLAGRLEIFSLLLPFFPDFWRDN